MISKQELEILFPQNGTGLHAYLEHKHQGGINNAKGNTFENFFSVFKIASYCNDFSSSKHNKILFSSQVKCFVDDLIIEEPTEQNYFQIKDTQTLNWNAGPHTLKDDFIYQSTICKNSKIPYKLLIVVSSEELANSLSESMPDDIRGFTEVIQFLTNSSISNLLRTNQAFKEQMIKMCALSNPHTDVLETLATIILGAWDSSDKKNISLTNLLNLCYNQNPHYIKGFENRISENLQAVLGAIQSFSFILQGGYIRWKYNNTDSGIIPYQIGSRQFLDFENNILHKKPVNFEELFNLL